MYKMIMLPGLFGNEGVCNKIQDFFEKLHFSCFPITLPYRVKFAKTPDARLGEIGEKDDIDFLLMKVKEIKKNLKPGELLIGMGYSRGAMLVLKLQQIFFDKGEKLFDKIVLITPAPPKGVSALSWPAVKSYLGIRPLWKFWKKPVKRNFASMATAVLEKRMPIQDKKNIFEDFSWESGRVIFETLFTPPEIDPKKIKCPVLVIAGAYDILIPPSIAIKIAKMFKATYRVVGGTHFMLKGSARKTMCEVIAEWIYET